VIPLQLPPLRERRQDIMALVGVFLEKFCRLMGRSQMTISRRALETLEQHPWPGNVRELENLVERLVALTEGDVIHVEDLPAEMSGQRVVAGDVCLELTENGMDMVAAITEIERGLINRALELSGGIKARAAVLLGINRTTLVEKMKRMGMGLAEL
jgi:DNA-binding NtrC family response regulator